jgi:stress response protein YsnF
VGNTLIVPVLEEVLVVQKRIRLREEIHITRHRRETHAPQSVTVRTERVEVKRLDDKSSS